MCFQCINLYALTPTTVRRLSKSEVVDFIRANIDPDAVSSGGNWVDIPVGAGQERIFFSQCKPSSASKGHWSYDFFHTIAVERIGEIAANGATIVLINYLDKKFSVLDGEDIVWLCVYSVRNKSNEGVVCDIVVEKDDNGDFFLRPYDRIRSERRKIEVKKFD